MKNDPAGRSPPEAPHWIVAAYDRLLSLYPREFRRRFGASMKSAFRAEWEERRGTGWVSSAVFWARTLWTTGYCATEEWLRLGSRRFAVFRSGWLAGLGSDLHAALKTVARAPKMSVAAVLCIGLGTAATTAVLTLYASALMRPLPFRNAERLVRVWLEEPGASTRGQLALPDFEDLAEQITALDSLVATGRSRLMFLNDEGARRVEGEAVTPGYFRLLGIRPHLGRFFAEEEHRIGSDPVMVLSHRTWTDHFGGDPSVVGSILRTTTRSYTVAGVAPPAFHGTLEDDIPDIEFWVPMVHDRSEEERRSRTTRYIWTIGRLGPGSSLAAAAHEVEAIGERIARAHPETRRRTSLWAERMGENWREHVRGRSVILLLAAGMLLLVAATNTAGLLTTRSLDRREDMALRAALGADGGRLVRQILAETLTLTATGTILGSLFAPTILRTFLRLAPEEVPAYVTIQLDLRALGMVVGVLILTSLVAGILPAVIGRKTRATEALGTRSPTSGRSRRSLGEALVVAEVATTVVLLVATGLLLRSYHAMGQIDLGYRTAGILGMALFVDTADVDRDVQLRDLHVRIHRRLEDHPGVERLALVSPTVPPGRGGDTQIRWRGMPMETRDRGLTVSRHRVDPEFLPTMEIAIVAGRGIESGDADRSIPAAVVSEAVAELLGGVHRALGRELEVAGAPHEIVGVVRNVKYFGPVLRRPRDLDVYTSLGRSPARVVSIAIATRGDPAGLIAPMSERLNALAPRSALDWVDPTTAAIDGHFQGPRFYLFLLLAFATSSLGLTAVGLFATLASLVAKRSVEIGIRRALGAERRALIRSVMARALLLVGIGLAIGAVGALLAGRLVRSMLYGVQAADPVTLAATAGVVIVVAMLASALPALRAARVSPLSALKGG